MAPTLLALLMTATGSGEHTVLAYHLFTIACGAVVVWIYYDVARRWVPPTTAALLGIALATTPQFSAQVSLLGMDVPMVAAAMGAARCVHQDRIARALAASVLAFLLKPTGALVTVAIVGCLLVAWLLAAPPAKSALRRRKRLLSLGVGLLMLETLLIVAAGTFVNIPTGRE